MHERTLVLTGAIFTITSSCWLASLYLELWSFRSPVFLNAPLAPPRQLPKPVWLEGALTNHRGQ